MDHSSSLIQIPSFCNAEFIKSNEIFVVVHRIFITSNGSRLSECSNSIAIDCQNVLQTPNPIRQTITWWGLWWGFCAEDFVMRICGEDCGEDSVVRISYAKTISLTDANFGTGLTAKSIICNTAESIVFNTESIIVSTKSIILNTTFITFRTEPRTWVDGLQNVGASLVQHDLNTSSDTSEACCNGVM